MSWRTQSESWAMTFQIPKNPAKIPKTPKNPDCLRYAIAVPSITMIVAIAVVALRKTIVWVDPTVRSYAYIVAQCLLSKQVENQQAVVTIWEQQSGPAMLRSIMTICIVSSVSGRTIILISIRTSREEVDLEEWLHRTNQLLFIF